MSLTRREMDILDKMREQDIWIDEMIYDYGLSDEEPSVSIFDPLRSILKAIGLREDFGKATKWKKVQDYWISAEALMKAIELTTQGWETKTKKEMIGVSLWKRRPAMYPFREK